MPHRLPVASGAAAIALFLAYACNFLYFFVDDEGIAFVFAENLLDGRGFVYNSFEGRVEGYSDFLHVVVSAAWLGVLRAAGLDKIHLFFIGKAWSLLAGTLVIAVTFHAMRRLERVRGAGAAAGLAFLALAGPLAMWSCSSLETVPAALLTSCLIATLLVGGPAGERVALLCAGLLVLLRLDGFVYAGAVLASFWLFADPPRRRRLELRVGLPLAGLFAAYHAWRVWYFGEWLSAPLYAKVLYKFLSRTGLVVNQPETPYAVAFLGVYGLPLAVTALLLLVVTTWRQRAARPLLAASLLLGAYAAFVGDWMAGFRFFVPVLAPIALLIALAVSAVTAAPVRLGTSAALVAWFAWAAYGFAARYDPLEYRESWWASPSLSRERFFGPYYGLYEDTRGWIPPGTRTAFNQAGFLPFMLDLDNLDDVGLCSLFVAKMPTTDVVFTEAGRYSPLVGVPTLRTANAYVLYREPRFVITRHDVLRNANFGNTPPEILAGRYRLRVVDRARENVVYERTEVPVTPFDSDPTTFLENLAHTSRLRRAVVEGRTIPAREYVDMLPYLAGRVRELTLRDRFTASIEFATTEAPVYELALNGIKTSEQMAAVLTLQTGAGTTARRTAWEMEPGEQRTVHVRFDQPVLASRLTIELVNLGRQPSRVTLFDLRAQGQPPRLVEHLEAFRLFPPRQIQ